MLIALPMVLRAAASVFSSAASAAIPHAAGSGVRRRAFCGGLFGSEAFCSVSAVSKHKIAHRRAESFFQFEVTCVYDALARRVE